jgi:hypothetical protein
MSEEKVERGEGERKIRQPNVDVPLENEKQRIVHIEVPGRVICMCGNYLGLLQA